ncbi:MAG: hypothetical protein ACQEUN_05950 [Pseudomonadota bacterium]
MCALQIVVDRLEDWQPYYPSEDLITADDSLTRTAINVAVTLRTARLM